MNNRFFHIRPLVRVGRKWDFHQHGGATVKVTATENPFTVLLQVAYCSKKDHFVKKKGREEAEKATEYPVQLRYLGSELADIATRVEELTKVGTADVDYSYAIRYFLPKE